MAARNTQKGRGAGGGIRELRVQGLGGLRRREARGPRNCGESCLGLGCRVLQRWVGLGGGAYGKKVQTADYLNSSATGVAVRAAAVGSGGSTAHCVRPGRHGSLKSALSVSPMRLGCRSAVTVRQEPQVQLGLQEHL